MRDRVLKFVQDNGPVLPVEVSSKMEMNSFLANAFLEELSESNQILASKEKVGSVRLYYIKNQESKVGPRLNELGIDLTKTPSTFAKKSTVVTPELIKKREGFSSKLKKIEIEEQKIREKKALKLAQPQQGKPIPIPSPQTKSAKPLKAVGNFFKKKISRSESRIGIKITNPKNEASVENFADTAINYLREKNIKILTEPKEISSKESEVTVYVPSGVGPVKFLVKVKQKKKINKSDLMQYYAEALERRTPVILLAEGELATTAKAYLKEVGGFLRVKLFK